MKLLKAHWAWLATSYHMRGPRVLAPSSGIHGELGALPSMVRLCLYIDFNSRYGVGQGHPVFMSPLFKLGDSVFPAWG